MKRKFESKVALVTGSASGIGRATAMAFADEGAIVVAADINAKGAEETAGFITAAGGTAISYCVDVSKTEQVEKLIRKTIEAFGRLDCAHNNAGIAGMRKKVADFAEESWDETIAVNLEGVWICMKYEIRAMLETGGGSIVNTSSVYGLLGAPRLSAYAASKHAIIGLTKSASLEYCRSWFRINAVCPGLIDTGMAEKAILGDPDADPNMEFSLTERLLYRAKSWGARNVLASKQPSRRAGMPEEVANVVLWLSSEDASYINGQAIVIDGGMVIA